MTDDATNGSDETKRNPGVKAWLRTCLATALAGIGFILLMAFAAVTPEGTKQDALGISAFICFALTFGGLLRIAYLAKF
jgi:uncharacterized membrane protein YidH (DUF202 family)